MTEGRGAAFGEVHPLTQQGNLDLSFQDLGAQSEGLETGAINQLATLNDYREGQQLIFWLGVNNRIFEGTTSPGDDNWITRLRLKPWWARPAREYRVPGNPTFNALDTAVFGGGPTGGVNNNRYVWIPSAKRLDVTEYGAAPPPIAPVRHSDSIFLDDLWTFDSFRDPTDAAYQAQFPAPQLVSRWAVFTYPAMGYALGFTWEATFNQAPGGDVPRPTPFISLTWKVGTIY